MLRSNTILAQEFWNRYSAGENFFSGIRLYVVGLEGKVFQGINLSESILEGDWNDISLIGSNLANITANDTNFHRADLSRTELTRAVFNQCDLTECIFAEANLMRAAFRQTGCYATNFTGANLKESVFEETELNTSTFINADLQGAKGIGTDSLRYFNCVVSNTRMPNSNIATWKKE